MLPIEQSQDYSQEDVLRRIKQLFNKSTSIEENIDYSLEEPDYSLEEPRPYFTISGEERLPRVTELFTESIVKSSVSTLFSHKLIDEERFVKEVRAAFPNCVCEKEEVLGWTEEIFTGNIIQGLLDTAKTITDKNSTITPWTIEVVKEKANLTALLGPTRKSLPIIVVVDDEHRYTHLCTEELIFGILSVTEASGRFSFFLQGINSRALLLSNLENNYNPYMVGNKKYSAEIIQPTFTETITFETNEVVRGIMTGCSWLNKDPHSYIKDITDGITRLTF